MASVVFTDTARRHIQSIVRNIRKHNRVAARDWVDGIVSRCELLARYPRMGRVRADLSVDAHVFPYRNYLIFYDISDAGIIVLYIIDGRQDLPNLSLDEE